MLKRTKIVATISSLNCEVDFLKKLFEAGMDVARLNTAHMNTEDAEMMIRNIRAVSPNIAIMIDTKGPEVRTGMLEQPLPVIYGQKVSFSADGEGGEVPVNYAGFSRCVRTGQRILIDDGTLELLVDKIDGKVVIATALNEGEILKHKSVNVPGANLPLPALSKRDREFINFAVDNDIDFIAHSFVRSRDDIMAVRSILETAGSHIGVIAKIENHQGVDNLEEIINAADGLMVARGDLGVELPLEEVPRIQKRMIYMCMKYHKPVITATQMLQSMITNPRPTRAEVSDVANAVFDGTDAVMLSGETSMGKYPLESVKMMSSIICEIEGAGQQHFTKVDDVECADNPMRGWLVRNAVKATEKLPVKAIVGLTDSGVSARMAAAYRGRTLLYFSSPNPGVMRQLALSYGVYAYFHAYEARQNAVFEPLLAELVKEHKLRKNDLIACLASAPPEKNITNFLSFNQVDELL